MGADLEAADGSGGARGGRRGGGGEAEKARSKEMIFALLFALGLASPVCSRKKKGVFFWRDLLFVCCLDGLANLFMRFISSKVRFEVVDD